MLKEYLLSQGSGTVRWSHGMPGVEICRFSLPEQEPLRPIPVCGAPLQFEVLFCLTGEPERRQETSASCLLRCFCQASDAPSSRQAARASSSGASLQITLSQARLAPSSLQRDSQLRIHSPSPQP